MVLLNVKDGRKYFGDVRLFDNLNFHIDEGQKCGLVGANGAGKTSLFKVLTGEMELDSGDIFISPSASIGYLKQNIEYASDKTVLEEVMEVFSHLFEMEASLEEIRTMLEKEPSESLIKRQDALLTEYEAAGGLIYKAVRAAR